MRTFAGAASLSSIENLMLESRTSADVGPMIMFWVVLALSIGGIALAVVTIRHRERAWATFAKAHDCRVVERMRGDIQTTVAPIFDGKGSVSYAVGVTETSDKTAYLCNDGVKYWR